VGGLGQRAAGGQVSGERTDEHVAGTGRVDRASRDRVDDADDDRAAREAGGARSGGLDPFGGETALRAQGQDDGGHAPLDEPHGERAHLLERVAPIDGALLSTSTQALGDEAGLGLVDDQRAGGLKRGQSQVRDGRRVHEQAAVGTLLHQRGRAIDDARVDLALQHEDGGAIQEPGGHVRIGLGHLSVAARRHDDRVLARSVDGDESRAGRPLHGPDPGHVDAGTVQSGQGGLGEPVRAHGAHECDVRTGQRGGDRLVGALAAGADDEVAAGHRLARLREGGDAHAQVHVDRTQNDDAGLRRDRHASDST
jgi:hypothetical protein